MHSPLLPQPDEFVAKVMDWMLLAMWAMFVFALLVATSRVAPSYTVPTEQRYSQLSIGSSVTHSFALAVFNQHADLSQCAITRLHVSTPPPDAKTTCGSLSDVSMTYAVASYDKLPNCAWNSSVVVYCRKPVTIIVGS